MRAKRSTNCSERAFCACAASTRWITRAIVVSSYGLLTTTSSEPRPLMLPPKTSSPVRFSTPSGSPVIGASFTSDDPESTVPSIAMRSPGFTTIVSPGMISWTGRTTAWSPRTC
ncbi:MAG: hypothetical protein BWY99_00852 [Synergistetes bacterium ADurb.BinA166]|nr:MAG: hypothetical protein BWY99_00852 [Synergistetes bacterium ADurb.BinA166]